MPVLFGEPGRPMTLGYSLTEIGRACIRHEFQVLAARRASPITDWLRAFCRELHAEVGGPGVGAIGMCFTGNFALTLYVDPSVMAPVLSQPSLPFAITPALRRGMHISDEDLATVQHRVRDEGGKVLGLRFTNDFMCPEPRFRALKDALGDGFEAIEIDSSRGNPHGIGPMAHSVLSFDFVDQDGHPTKEAYLRVVEFFRERLSAA
jgi:dienelactone hydrolase